MLEKPVENVGGIADRANAIVKTSTMTNHGGDMRAHSSGVGTNE